MLHQSDLGRVSILHVALNEEHLHELRLHTDHTLIQFSGLYMVFQY